VTINAFTMEFESTKAIEAVRADVASVWTDLQPDQVTAMLGVTPMIGVATTETSRSSSRTRESMVLVLCVSGR
jgi:hypothetical protein